MICIIRLSIFLQQRGTLAAAAAALHASVLAKDTREGRKGAEDKGQAGNGERKWPLKRNSLGAELSNSLSAVHKAYVPSNCYSPNSQRKRQVAGGKANIVVLEGEQEEAGVHQLAPDGDVCENARNNVVVCVYNNSSVPVQHEEVESERHDRSGEMDQARSGGMAEVQGDEVEEVDDENDEGKDVQAPSPAYDPEEVEEVVPSGISFQCRNTSEKGKLTE